MTDSTTFCYTRIAGADRNWQPLYRALRSDVLPSLEKGHVSAWGVWSGLFGIASNELVLMTAAPRQDHAAQLNARLASLTGAVAEQHVLDATVRPTGTAECTRPGLYVFRFFDIYNRDVGEIAELSEQAWTTFESAPAYRAQPQGLFCLHDRSDVRGIMLLCTWYDGFESWQISRDPPPEARANFQRRHELTFGTRAVATRLISPVS